MRLLDCAISMILFIGIAGCSSTRQPDVGRCIRSYSPELRDSVVLPELNKRHILLQTMNLDDPFIKISGRNMTVTLSYDATNMFDSPEYELVIDRCSRDVLKFKVIDTSVVTGGPRSRR